MRGERNVCVFTDEGQQVVDGVERVGFQVVFVIVGCTILGEGEEGCGWIVSDVGGCDRDPERRTLAVPPSSACVVMSGMYCAPVDCDDRSNRLSWSMTIEDPLCLVLGDHYLFIYLFIIPYLIFIHFLFADQTAAMLSLLRTSSSLARLFTRSVVAPTPVSAGLLVKSTRRTLFTTPRRALPARDAASPTKSARASAPARSKPKPKPSGRKLTARKKSLKTAAPKAAKGTRRPSKKAAKKVVPKKKKKPVKKPVKPKSASVRTAGWPGTD